MSSPLEDQTEEITAGMAKIKTSEPEKKTKPKSATGPAHCELCLRDPLALPADRLQTYSAAQELAAHKLTHNRQSVLVRAIRRWPGSVDGFTCPICPFHGLIADGYRGLWAHVIVDHPDYFKKKLWL
ncbi:hypothetical protein Dda_6571 [Drechslerella dactyloides]|uniref:Uncharacterized protein n=1 Tax=Drechslerella dactyloides TaxID=74499 RepID=A0AAD6IUD9_DREDA|nr:hypothetical protein Dda_6571 [Drechslerella dactyloides]